MKARFILSALATVMLANPAVAHLECGQVWLIDKVNSSLYRIKIDTLQTFTTLTAADGLNGVGAIGFNLHGHMMLANYNNSEIWEYDGDSSPTLEATSAVGLNGPYGATGLIISPGHGDVFISNFDNNEILVLDEEFANPEVFADATDGINHPVAMAFLADGTLVVGNDNNEILAFDELGAVSFFDLLPPAGVITSMTVRDNGDLYVLTLGGFIFKYAGGDSASKSMLGQYGPSVGSPGGIEFDYDFSRIFHINQVTAELREIDPDTGVDTVLVAFAGKRPFAVSVTCSELPHGSFKPFGEGLAGEGGITPILESHDEPRIGEPLLLHLEEFVGGSFAYLFLGLGEAELPAFGGDFHVDISGASFYVMKIFGGGGTPGLAGDGHVDLPAVLPNDPALIGSEWYLQYLVPDAAAPEGVAMSNSLKMYVGDAP